MDGIELTKRLIEDIEHSLEIRNSVPDVHTQIKQIGDTANDLGDFVGALNVIAFDGHLRIVTELINGNDVIIQFNKDNIPNVLEQVIENKDEIEVRLQNMLGNDDIVTIDSFNNIEPIENILLEKLDDLHESSGKFLI